MPVLETKQIARLLKSLPQIKKIDHVDMGKVDNEEIDENMTYDSNENFENLIDDE